MMEPARLQILTKKRDIQFPFQSNQRIQRQ